MLKLMKMFIISHISCMCMLKTLKSYFLSKFQVYNSVALTVITILYFRSPMAIYLITKSLYFLTNIAISPNTPW